MTEARGEAVHVCARILLKYTLNIDEENKVGGKLTVWFRSLLSLLGEPLEADESAEEEELSHRPTVGDDVGEDDQGKVAVTPPHDTHEQAEGPMGHEQTWDVDQRLSCAV